MNFSYFVQQMCGRSVNQNLSFPPGISWFKEFSSGLFNQEITIKKFHDLLFFLNIGNAIVLLKYFCSHFFLIFFPHFWVFVLILVFFLFTNEFVIGFCESSEWSTIMTCPFPLAPPSLFDTFKKIFLTILFFCSLFTILFNFFVSLKLSSLSSDDE